MRTPTTSLRFPSRIHPCIKARAKALKMSVSAYLISLARYDLMINKPHDATGDFHRLPREEQDKIDAEIARAYQAGESLGGTWFEHRIADAAKEAALPEPPPKSKVAAKLRKKLSGE